MKTCKKKSKLPFMRGYCFVLKDKKLSPAEKLVMMAICRYWPQASFQTNDTIAESIGVSARYVQMIIARLVGKKYIHRGYAHTTKKGKPYTARAIVPTQFHSHQKPDVKWIKRDEQLFTPCHEQTDTPTTNNRAFCHEQPFTLLDSNRDLNKRGEKPPSPSEQRAAYAKRKVKESAQFRDRKQQAIKTLLASQ